MRIAHVIWSMRTGGVETMLVDILNEQVKICKVRVFVVNNYYDSDLLDKIDKKVKIIRLNRKPRSWSLWPIIRLNALLLAFHPNVIHCHQSNMAPLIKVPYKKVLTIHNTHCKPNYLGRYDRLFCISRSVENSIAQLGFSNGIVVYNGIHPESITEKDYTHVNNNTIKKIVCVGRLNIDKGQRVLIEATNVLVQVRKQTGFTIDLIGDGEEREGLEKMVDDYGLSNYVNFLGKKPRSWFYPRLNSYDLFVMPSISEGFGLTLAEACAAKLPVLTCDLAGPMEVIDGGRLGETFITSDVVALADGIERFLVDGPNRNQIEAAYEFVKNNFDVTRTARQYIAHYEKM